MLASPYDAPSLEAFVEDTKRHGAMVEKVGITFAPSASTRHIYVRIVGSSLPDVIQSEATESGLIMIDAADRHHPGWYAEAAQQLRSLATLAADWNSYGAEPPNDEAIGAAKSVVDQLATLGIRPTKIGASAVDGVIVRVTSGMRYADVECYNTGEIVATRREKGSEPIITEIAKSDIPWTVSRMVDYLFHG